MPVIIWINGGFGAGKTTLAGELHRRLPGALVYDPEDVGLMLWKWMPPNGDFQHLPAWRELVVATALSLRRHHAETLIVPMSLIRGAYRAQILGGLAEAGEEVLHVFLEADAGVLRERLNARVTHPGGDWEQGAREVGMTGVDEMVAAAACQPAGTLLLRSDRLTPAELAGKVLAAAGLHRLTREEAELRRKRARQGRQQAEVERASAESQRKRAAALPDHAALAERSKLLRQQSLAMLEALAANEEEVARVHEDLAARHPDGRDESLRIAEQARAAARRARETLRSFAG